MTDFNPTYVFDGDDVKAMHNGVVIASGKVDQMEAVESDATDYLEGLKLEADERKRSSATHIVTPNGVKGKILNRVGGVWGEEISVKFENGEHQSFTVTAGTVADWVTEAPQKTASSTPISSLQSRLDAEFNTDRPSLVARHDELKAIATEARSLITKGASYKDQTELDRIRAIADAESEEVDQAIQYIDANDIEPYRPPSPVVVEQADLGRADGWIDVVHQDMTDEADGQDYDKILSDEPVLLAADLDTPVLSDQGVAREMALSHVLNRTAAYQGEDVEKYRDSFLARFEVARRRELSNRQEDTQKEAATATSAVVDAPDEAFFM